MTTTLTDNLTEWQAGFGVIHHRPETLKRIRALLEDLSARNPAFDRAQAARLFAAADRVANAAMWLVVHETYANKVYLDGRPLRESDFKPNPQGHTGGSLNMVVAYVGYMLANALTQTTRSWLMGQGHCVAAIDSVNLLLDNTKPEHAERYNWSEAGLARYVNDFYSYRLDDRGHQDSPLGSHVNVHTAGGVLEGGYLGFADLQYVHMPLPGERLVAFLSDGAFEEQRGADWTPRWWRAEDSGLVMPIMIFNGRRIDQRSMMAMEGGVRWFIRHLENYDFEPFDFDGTDPAAFAWAILHGERLLEQRAEQVLAGSAAYPVKVPYGIAVAPKGAGFYGAGTNDAHGLPLADNPREDEVARRHFNASAHCLYVNPPELDEARKQLVNHAQSGRLRERDHPIANRDTRLLRRPELTYRQTGTDTSPMDGIDDAFLAFIKANPELRPRVGNPDEMRSNRMNGTLDFLKHRVTLPEAGIAEAVDGGVITALNEEAVICACLGNKAGINLAVTYEAFAPKMLGALRQEIIWSEHVFSVGREPGWLSVPLILTSNTYENGKNERSHQDTIMCEALLAESSNVSRVLFPADFNCAMAALETCYTTRGRIFSLVVPKSPLPIIFDRDQAQQLISHGAILLGEMGPARAMPRLILTAIGAFQLRQVQRAAQRLAERGISCRINYIMEPGRFRDPRGSREAAVQVTDAVREALYPTEVVARVFVSHARPEPMAGVLRPLDTGRKTIFLGYTNHGGTLDTNGMLFVNRQSWAHIVRASSRVLDIDLAELLAADEIAALNGHASPQGLII